jgi:hypothetical protein
MTVTSIVVFAIVGSAFVFNAKKIGTYCVTTANGSGNCYTMVGSKRTTAIDAPITLKYVPCWDPNDGCNSTSPCGTLAKFTED